MNLLKKILGARLSSSGFDTILNHHMIKPKPKPKQKNLKYITKMNSNYIASLVSCSPNTKICM